MRSQSQDCVRKSHGQQGARAWKQRSYCGGCVSRPLERAWEPMLDAAAPDRGWDEGLRSESWGVNPDWGLSLFIYKKMSNNPHLYFKGCWDNPRQELNTARAVQAQCAPDNTAGWWRRSEDTRATQNWPNPGTSYAWACGRGWEEIQGWY